MQELELVYCHYCNTNVSRNDPHRKVGNEGVYHFHCKQVYEQRHQHTIPLIAKKKGNHIRLYLKEAV